ncbi:hypothetical protein [Hazenella coriacea]|uniref:Uncharacterized protein n=1 Tax=Hazenella coriacea TaxID=1179467 RepID=A0A4R3L9N9_9BACL|nr:hypothetical protein [Hazenella coriacea]TCS96801.1 hypothetical protein EDD58_101443 [Hazenella coriacea]
MKRVILAVVTSFALVLSMGPASLAQVDQSLSKVEKLVETPEEAIAKAKSEKVKPRSLDALQSNSPNAKTVPLSMSTTAAPDVQFDGTFYNYVDLNGGAPIYLDGSTIINGNVKQIAGSSANVDIQLLDPTNNSVVFSIGWDGEGWHGWYFDQKGNYKIRLKNPNYNGTTNRVQAVGGIYISSVNPPATEQGDGSIDVLFKNYVDTNGGKTYHFDGTVLVNVNQRLVQGSHTRVDYQLIYPVNGAVVQSNYVYTTTAGMPLYYTAAGDYKLRVRNSNPDGTTQVSARGDIHITDFNGIQ